MATAASSAANVMDSIAVDPAVREFAVEKGVEPALALGLQLVVDCFPGAVRVRPEMAADPETGERWIAIEFDTRGTSEQILDRYRRLKELWVQATDANTRLAFAFAFDAPD